MKKKVVKKRSYTRKKSSSYKVYGYSIVITGCLLLVVFAKYSFGSFSQSQVLGTSILAQGGDDSGSGGSGSGDSGSSGGSGSSGSGSSGGSGSSDSSGSGGSGSGGSSGSTQTTTQTSGDHFAPPVNNTTVNTALPPQHSGSNQFRPAIVPSVTGTTDRHKGQVQLPLQGHGSDDLQNDQQDSDTLEVQTKDDDTVDLKQEGTQVELRNENGKLSLKAKKADGTEVELNDDALTSVNSDLESDGTQIQQQPDGSVLLSKHGVAARTHFPLSIDLITHQLTVTTPAGVKTVAVLPDQAVNNLINHGVITNVTGNASDSANLTEVNNQPVFEVQGQSNQKLLGIVPVTVNKTVDVSAETGDVVTENETFGQKLLDLVSF